MIGAVRWESIPVDLAQQLLDQVTFTPRALSCGRRAVRVRRRIHGPALGTGTESAQAIPGVESRVMTVRPVDLDRVLAHELQVGEEDVGRDGVENKSPNTGPLIDTTGTRALAAQISVSVDPDVACFPSDLQ